VAALLVLLMVVGKHIPWPIHGAGDEGEADKEVTLFAAVDRQSFLATRMQLLGASLCVWFPVIAHCLCDPACYGPRGAVAAKEEDEKKIYIVSADQMGSCNDFGSYSKGTKYVRFVLL
jgi:hypothetical protein